MEGKTKAIDGAPKQEVAWLKFICVGTASDADALHRTICTPFGGATHFSSHTCTSEPA
jgi:hypothetical protein